MYYSDTAVLKETGTIFPAGIDALQGQGVDLEEYDVFVINLSQASTDRLMLLLLSKGLNKLGHCAKAGIS